MPLNANLLLLMGKIVPIQAKLNAIVGDLVLEQDGIHRVTLSMPEPISPIQELNAVE